MLIFKPKPWKFKRTLCYVFQGFPDGPLVKTPELGRVIGPIITPHPQAIK